jgi:hypothetical protein
MIVLGRQVYSPVMGTFGFLQVGDWRCASVEEIWKDNQVNISCIPVGIYPLRPAVHHISTPDPDDDYACYEICEVPGRSAIHVHVAQTIKDVKGCVGTGMRHGILDGRWAVMQSRQAFSEFMERTDTLERGDGGDLWIQVVNVSPDGGILSP